MKIDKISYQKTYPTGQYANEKIGMEATLDPGEDIQFAMCNLKHECDEIHQKNNPHLYQNNNSLYSSEQPIENYKSPGWDTLEPGYVTDTNVGDIIQQSENQNLTPSQKIIAQINQCTEEKVLKSFELLAKNNEEIKTAYDIKLSQLNK